MNFGKKIKKKLIDEDMTLRELSEAMDVGYTTLTNAVNGWTQNDKAADLLIKAWGYLKSLEDGIM